MNFSLHSVVEPFKGAENLDIKKPGSSTKRRV